MLRRVMIAGSTVTLGHRYWRISVSAPAGSTSYIGFTEIELRGTSGGPDLMSAQTVNGAASASSEINASNGAWMAADGRMTYGWLSESASPAWWKYDFGSPLNAGPAIADVKQVAIYGSYNAPNASHKDFQIQWSDDGSAWTTVLSVTGQTGWTGASDIRLFDIP